MKHIAFAALLTVTAASLLAAVAMRRQRDSARSAADDAISLATAAGRALDDANRTVRDLQNAVPVWFMAGAPLVEVVPTADDFCLN